MKRKYLCILLLFVIFMPRVYAFTYEMDMSVDKTNVSVGTTKEIKVSLKNIQGTDDGIGYCSMNIDFDNNIVLNTDVRTLGSWSKSVGDIYAFDTLDFATSDTALFVIPVKVNGEGSVKLSNIVCSDGHTNSTVGDKNISFTIVNPSNNTSGNGNSKPTEKDEDVKSSNCDLSNIILSEGTIEFDSSVTEYYVKVTDLDNFRLTAELADDLSSYMVDRNITEDGESYVITVTAQDGSNKIYTVYLEDINEDNDNVDDKKEKNNTYIPIFIGIIGVLILINIFRIIKNKKK